MNDTETHTAPAAISAIQRDTSALGFDMCSEPRVGSLLAVLATSKPGGHLLELGTGTGHGTAWILAGMDPTATLDTVDNDPRVVAIAQRHLGSDPRLRFHIKDGAQFLQEQGQDAFDLIYADAWPGKFSHLSETLELLRPGGIYVIDDLLLQPNWPEGHVPKVPELVMDLERRSEFMTMRLTWASGLMLVVRKAS